MRFGKGEWRSFERGAEKEWLVTNGLGGYASATIIGANTRKYHGLLVASLQPPVRRTLLLAKLEERVETAGRVYNLATNQTDRGVTEFGFVHLQQVLLDSFPTFIYSFADIILQKQVFMVYGENTTVIVYRIHNGAEAALLRLTPLVNCRDFHWTTRKGQVSFTQEKIAHGTNIRNASGVPPLRLVSSAGDFSAGEDWFYNMYYAAESERGESALEDHFIPGQFTVPLAAGQETTVTFIATVEDVFTLDGPALQEMENRRLQELVERAGYRDGLARRLVQAADAFIVRRDSTGAKSIIAGYHWFNDWGRDTMIALPGLTLVTRRFEDAREILFTFARYCKDGLLPNMFPDADGEPLYNTADASLWYFQAVWKYLQYTGDYSFVRGEIYPVLKEIIRRHVEGTRFNIKMDADGLLTAGSPGVQLTWMDAKVDQWVVTPRHGKPVEINALWYNALCIMRELAVRYEDEFPYQDLPGRVRDSFRRQFWFAGGNYLYDVIVDGGADASLRPNQIIALSLPYTMLDREQGRQVLRRVWQELYATYGLRSLSPGDPAYRGVYSGDRVQRDGAYHQGTVWSWLIGPFVTAFRRVHNYSTASRLQAARLLSPFRDHLRDHGTGFISEIFDGNEPVIPRGAIAQAWGVAEVLRAYVEDVLEIKPEGAGGSQQ
ncbi:amylo-alpha-1,6-glucosidase [Desulfotomaculum copahuensis]|uniref:Glycogen debranching protein n=1 Tax=Desulfotomaculum copahuensis TaxID=1838280 RepID=A0A1B7LBY0_9FIRM|nr:amylo-alpha-1,6-glucosidase [Desulfotomaculum copahuensis]OAT80246.1 glycogen debranching protein [Desulfotomaculum copahuensis]